MAKLDLQAFDPMVKDMYPLPGSRLKQWVVDASREGAWECETCPRIDVDVHLDNCDDGSGLSTCRNHGSIPWTFLDHDACSHCNDLYEAAGHTTRVIEWQAQRALRPPVETDRSKLSDEFEPEWKSLRSWRGPRKLDTSVKSDKVP